MIKNIILKLNDKKYDFEIKKLVDQIQLINVFLEINKSKVHKYFKFIIKFYTTVCSIRNRTGSFSND